MTHDELKAWFEQHRSDASVAMAVEVRAGMSPADVDEARAAVGEADADHFELALVHGLVVAIEAGASSSRATFLASLAPAPVAVAAAAAAAGGKAKA